jgi:hypothetical protein
MDNSMINLYLNQSRYTRLIGEKGTIGAEGGTLNIKLINNLELQDSTAVIIVGIDVLALPDGSKKSKAFVFKLGITLEGIYSLDDSSDALDFSNEDLRLTLAQPLYTMGAIELRDLAQKLGFSSVHLPWDVRTLRDQWRDTQEVTASTSKAKKAIKSVKKTTSR